MFSSALAPFMLLVKAPVVVISFPIDAADVSEPSRAVRVRAWYSFEPLYVAMLYVEPTSFRTTFVAPKLPLDPLMLPIRVLPL